MTIDPADHHSACLLRRETGDFRWSGRLLQELLGISEPLKPEDWVFLVPNRVQGTLPVIREEDHANVLVSPTSGETLVVSYDISERFLLVGGTMIERLYRSRKILLGTNGVMGPLNISDLIGEDGMTEREKGLSIPHRIPLGALVEVGAQGWRWGWFQNTRLYVVGHMRDNDGHPLYALAADFRDSRGIHEKTSLRRFLHFCAHTGFSECDMTLIAPPPSEYHHCEECEGLTPVDQGPRCEYCVGMDIRRS